MFDGVTDDGAWFQAVEIRDDMQCEACRSLRSWVMKKQRVATQAEREFDAEVAKFNQEAQKILGDRSLSMSARRRLISLKGKALLRPSASQPNSTP
jgi:hypothetical protein